MDKVSSRNLSVYEYYQVLQLEWIVADLRSKIYPDIRDKNYWNKVKEGKRRVIESIAEKNSLPTIFVDDEMNRVFCHKIFGDKGLPNFQYKDEANRQHQQPLDTLYYYNKGADVRFTYYEEIKVGKIENFSLYKSSSITIKLETDELITIPSADVTRIL